MPARRWGGIFRNDIDHRDFTSIGTAAGVATAFAAPIGGALFTIEEGCSFYSTYVFWRCFLATCSGVLTLHWLVKFRKQEEGAQADRTANLLVMEERAMHLRENQHRRLSQFSSRYVGSTQAEMFDSSQFRHYYMMDKAAEQEIAHANSELFKRIRATEAREDTDITDEDAGFQREAAAAASKARRAAEARKIAAQNAALQARLKNIKALTDNSIHDEEAQKSGALCRCLIHVALSLPR